MLLMQHPADDLILCRPALQPALQLVLAVVVIQTEFTFPNIEVALTV